MRISKDIFSLCILMILYGCQSNKERDFFELMRTSYSDIKIDSSFYYIKSFGLSDSSQKIDDNLYWKLRSDKKSEFFLSGFLRKFNDSIMVIPYDFIDSGSSVKEYKLFDFDAKPQQSWNVLIESNGNILLGDSVVFQRSEKFNHDQVYVYILYPYWFYPKSDTKDFRAGTFEVVVSKDKGILSIKSLSHGIHIDTVYKAILYPKVLFTNNSRNLLDL